MNRFELFAEELQRVVPFRIRYKDESMEMELLSIFVELFCPDFMTRYTTVIGSTIYFPSRYYVSQQGDNAMRILAHEAVHLLDAERWSMPAFMLGYLFPQILVLGVFSFPLLGFWSLLFLLFALPIPSPFRYYFESRAYAMDVMTASSPEHKSRALTYGVKQFLGWDYYKMYPFKEAVRDRILKWVALAEKGRDENMIKVLLLYEMVYES